MGGMRSEKIAWMKTTGKADGTFEHEGNAVDVLLGVLKAQGFSVNEESFRRASILCDQSPDSTITGKETEGEEGGEMR